MNPNGRCIRRSEFILSISVLFLIISISLFLIKNTDFSKKESYNIAYETYDIKTMGTAKISMKKDKKDNIVNNDQIDETNNKLTEISLKDNNVPTAKQEPVVTIPPKPTWRLPTEQGYITQYVHYNHIALDITSGRGTNERIYPVADGVISSIYYDSYGAKIVTVNHNINGKYYSSQYVHLSWYAEDIYVGKEVTTDTVLGGMGATGWATGIHLHITVMDCNLYDPNDPNCSTLNKFYNYGRIRVTQGFYGLENLMGVPYSWYSR